METDVFQDNLVDFTAHKIVKLAEQHEQWGDNMVAHSLRDMHHLYMEGYLKIVWEEGMPIPMLEKENEKINDSERTNGTNSR